MPDPEQLSAQAELTLATRRLMLAAATTDVAAEDLRAASADMDELAARLGTRRRDRVRRASADGPAAVRAAGAGRSWRTFVYNPQAFPLDIFFDGDTAVAHTTANALYEGPPGYLHGGFVAHLIDSVLGTLMQARGRRAVTATLGLRYLSATPLDVPLEVHGRLVSTNGRRSHAEGWIEHAGRRTVEADGLFVDIDQRTP